jgi:hypothetical protein
MEMTAGPEEFHAGSPVGDYILEARLGGGSFGSVWRARHSSSGRIVAIKLLTGVLATRGRAGVRAEVELLAATASSKSAHVVRVIGGGPEPVPYVVMEYIEGTDLASLLRERSKLSPEETIRIGTAVADALCALNQAGIIHRDVKPANVMVDRQGIIKLTDFGIAKIVGYETAGMTGLPMTMAYAAPEVWEGSASHQSDLYALGILLYQCLTGSPPFAGNNFGELYRQHASTPPDMEALPPETPPSLTEVIRLCAEKDPAARPGDAAVCLELLHRAQGELPKATVAPTMMEPARFGPWLRREAHVSQPWAWRCVHETSQEEATVEIHFAADVAYGAELRKAVRANPDLVSLGAERLLGTNRLLLRPGEGWQEPPEGEFCFWVAREELPDEEPPTVVTVAVLGPALEGLLALIDAGGAAGLSLSLAADRVVLLADGRVHVRRPGLPPVGDAPATEQALVFLGGLPLDDQTQDLVATAQDLRDLHASLAAIVAPSTPAAPSELGVAYPAEGAGRRAEPETEDTSLLPPPAPPVLTPPEPSPLSPKVPEEEAKDVPTAGEAPRRGPAAPPQLQRLWSLIRRGSTRSLRAILAALGAFVMIVLQLLSKAGTIMLNALAGAGRSGPALSRSTVSIAASGLRQLGNTARTVVSVPPRIPPKLLTAVAGWWRRRNPIFVMSVSSIVGGGAVGVALGITIAILLSGDGCGGEVTSTPTPTPTPSPTPPTSGLELAYVGADGNLWVSDSSGASARALTSDGRATHPAWSPDGREIAYVYVSGDPGDASAITAGQVATEIRVVDVQTHEPRTVLGPITYKDGDAERFALLRSPQWDSTGKAILYHEQRGLDDTGRIRRHPLEFVDGTPVGTTDRYDGTVVHSSFLPDPSTVITSFTLMPSEQGIVFEVGPKTGGVLTTKCWIEAMTGQVSQAMSTEIVAAPSNECHGLPTVDPQGRQLAFYAYPGGQSFIRLHNLETNEERDIASASPQSVLEYLFWPKVAWSGDGQYIAYESWDEAFGEEEILIQAATGGVPRKLAAGRHPAWARPEQRSCSGYECLLPPGPEAGQPAPYVYWVVAPTEATSGEPFSVVVLAKNVGDASGSGSIDVGLPEGPGVAEGPRDQNLASYTIVTAGTKLSVFLRNEGRICGNPTMEPSKYPVVYVWGGGTRQWAVGDEHFLAATITPRSALTLEIRATIETTIESQRCWVNYPADSPRVSQQNLPVIERQASLR